MVLIVDDEPSILRVISLALRDLVTDIAIATDAERALEMLQNLDPTLIIIDVRLPGIDGVELTRLVREDPKHANTSIMLISAFEEPSLHQADRFLPKPFDVDDLVDNVVTVLGQGRAE